jgi:hypothetical protein
MYLPVSIKVYLISDWNSVHHGVFMSTGEPYWCFGYQFGNQLSCVMDANFVPSETFDRMRNSDILIVDCLRGNLA